MPRVEFEPTITAFIRAKTVHALDCAVTVNGGDIALQLPNSVVKTLPYYKRVIHNYLLLFSCYVKTHENFKLVSSSVIMMYHSQLTPNYTAMHTTS
jgi:hypothetical protein